MAFGFPAYVKDRRNLVLNTEDTKALALEIVKELKWQAIDEHPFAIDYKTPNSIMTMGERVYINVTDKEIIIRSECLFPTRFFDFGKNKAVIKSFWDAYDEKLK
ncbi:MAG: hypothetical protein ACPGVH_09700 [Chitinophagales bacterium]